MKVTRRSSHPAWTLLMLVSVIAACVPSLNPLYTDEDLVFDELLLGFWVASDGDHWQFDRALGGSYVLTFSPQQVEEPADAQVGQPARFDAHLLQLGDDRFLDLYPASYRKGMELANGLLAIHLVPAHTFSRIWIDQGSVRIGMLDLEWLDKVLASGEIEIAHKRGDEGILLTATTPELQAFARAIADNDEAFGAVVKLTRSKAEDPVAQSHPRATEIARYPT